MYLRLHVKNVLFVSGFNETRIFLTDFRKYSNVKFHENPSIRNRVDPCWRTDVTKLRVAFRDFTARLRTILRPRKEIILFGPCVYSYIPLSLHCSFLCNLQFSSSSVFMNIDKGNQRECSLAEALWSRWHNRGC